MCMNSFKKKKWVEIIATYESKGAISEGQFEAVDNEAMTLLFKLSIIDAQQPGNP